MSIDRDDVDNYINRLEDDSYALADIRSMLDEHRKRVGPAVPGPVVMETDEEVIARLAATKDRYDEGVRDALAVTRAAASRERVRHVGPEWNGAAHVCVAVANVTPADVAAHVASRTPTKHTVTAVNTSGREIKKYEAVYVGVDPSDGRLDWTGRTGMWVDDSGGSHPFGWWTNIRDPGCFVRGCTRPYGHTDDHKLVYRADTHKRTIPPHAAITDTPAGRRATWYEPNRGGK